jgi:hypothetical protein
VVDPVIRNPSEHLGEHDLEASPSEIRAGAAMDSHPEGHMAIGRTVEPNSLGFVECRRIVVGGKPGELYALALLQLLTADLRSQARAEPVNDVVVSMPPKMSSMTISKTSWSLIGCSLTVWLIK